MGATEAVIEAGNANPKADVSLCGLSKSDTANFASKYGLSNMLPRSLLVAKSFLATLNPSGAQFHLNEREDYHKSYANVISWF